MADEIIIYQEEGKAVEVLLDTNKDTIWLTQRQMGEVFDTTPENVLMHLKNIYKDQELDQKATAKDFLVVRLEGTRRVKRKLVHYNLDAVISVGYRVNSKSAVRFRQWATRILREHLTKGWTLNHQRFEANSRELETALALVRKATRSPDLLAETGLGLVEIVSRYTQTFLLLQRYDDGLLTAPPVQAGGVLQTVEEARAALTRLKTELISRAEATPLFALERGDALSALLGNLEQTIFGKPAYPSVEGKAAHLLYFMVKNHPFADGNKRCGAFLFIDFLRRNHRLFNEQGEPVINDIGLTALTLLIAQSDPVYKETIINLIMNMLANEMN